jgi:excisionase family DNA binding protein
MSVRGSTSERPAVKAHLGGGWSVILGLPFKRGIARSGTETAMESTAKITCSVNEATHISGLSRTTIYRLLDQNKITSTVVGTKRLIHVDSLRRLLEAA